MAPVQQQVDAYHRRDLEQFPAAYAPDVASEDAGGNVSMRGHDGMRAMYGALFAQSPDMHAEIAHARGRPARDGSWSGAPDARMPRDRDGIPEHRSGYMEVTTCLPMTPHATVGRGKWSASSPTRAPSPPIARGTTPGSRRRVPYRTG